MAEWAFRAYDCVTGAATATLQVESWYHHAGLNHHGDQFFCRLAPPQDAVTARDVLAATFDTKCVILPTRGGKTLDGFTGWVPPGGRRRPDLTGGSLLSYFDHRIIDGLGAFVQTDQFTIAAGIVNTAQAPIGVILNGQPFQFPRGAAVDTTQVGTSGVLRDQEQWATPNLKIAGEALREKAALLNGYDFAIHTELDPGPEGLQVPVRRQRLYYPRRGSGFVAGQSPVFTVGEGGNAVTVPEFNGNELFVQTVFAHGKEIDSETQARELIRSTNFDTFVAGYPGIDIVLDLPSIISANTLADHGKGYLQRYAIITDDEITLDVNPNDTTYPYGSWQLGDDCRLEIPAGVDPWWPDGLDELRRVLAHRMWKDSAGERLHVVTGYPWQAAA